MDCRQQGEITVDMNSETEKGTMVRRFGTDAAGGPDLQDLPAGCREALAAMAAHRDRCRALCRTGTRDRGEVSSGEKSGGKRALPAFAEKWALNPSLGLFDNSWTGLADVLAGQGSLLRDGREMVMIWCDPHDGKLCMRRAETGDLLALKMASEGLKPEDVAAASEAEKPEIDAMLIHAIEDGVILGPEPGIRRKIPSGDKSCSGMDRAGKYLRPRIFALQWHITQSCDLHCRHCYDRKPVPPLPWEREIGILDQFSEFTGGRNLFGQVTFTGGNPLLHHRFYRLYQEAADRGFSTGILGNPCSGEDLDRICAIQTPSFFQVSLEGFQPHNDYIRGQGHFDRVIEFLELLKKRKIYAKVMLTLTRANMDQVIFLGQFLEGKADLFTFNRLSLEGEGAALEMADPGRYREFLAAYAEAAETCPVMGFKDNLFNPLFQEKSQPFFGGCTGFGCGAAFNFVSVLPTGEVHACRKFTSPIGDLTRETLEDVYTSEAARRYRRGPEGCFSCDAYTVCRGCMASAVSAGLDPFSGKDPYCFKR